MRNIIDKIEDKDVIDFLEYLKYERRMSVNTIDSYGENLLLISDILKKKLINLDSNDVRSFLLNIDAVPRTKAHYLTVLNSFLIPSIILSEPLSFVKPNSLYLLVCS